MKQAVLTWKCNQWLQMPLVLVRYNHVWLRHHSDDKYRLQDRNQRTEIYVARMLPQPNSLKWERQQQKFNLVSFHLFSRKTPVKIMAPFYEQLGTMAVWPQRVSTERENISRNDLLTQILFKQAHTDLTKKKINKTKQKSIKSTQSIKSNQSNFFSLMGLTDVSTRSPRRSVSEPTFTQCQPNCSFIRLLLGPKAMITTAQTLLLIRLPA